MINKKKSIFFITILFILSSVTHATIQINPYGHWNISCGLHIWQNYSVLRNLQFTSLLNLNDNLRINTVIRSNNEFNNISIFAPQIDEGYIQWQSFNKKDNVKIANSIKIGQLRYLRFPKPDIISMFDQVPGVEDQTSNM